MLKVKNKPVINQNEISVKLPISKKIEPIKIENSIAEHYPIVPNKIVDDLFTEQEIDFIKSFWDNFPEKHMALTGTEEILAPHFIEKKYMVFDNSIEFEDVNDLIFSKIKKYFHPHIKIGNIQLVTQYLPYRAHTNAMFNEHLWNQDNYAAWIILVPLDTYNCNTVIFNEYSFKTKIAPEYILERTHIDKIDTDTYNKYLTLESPDTMRYFSIDETVEWTKGRGIAFSRYKFFGDDNFLNNKIAVKQSLMISTALPNYLS